MMSPLRYGQILRDYSVIPRKKLGQHFMIDPALLKAVAALMVPDRGPWTALEIGAGIGTLTRELAGRARRVYALELDRSLAPAIEKTCGGLSNLQVIWGDALEYDLSGRLLEGENPGDRLLLCGNLPYYVTSEVLYSALVRRSSWDRMAFVVQEEVGNRMAGPPGTKDFGRLSLWCQYRARVVVERGISKGSFIPRPDVNSCVVTMEMRPSFPLSPEEEELLDRISRSVFSKRRKTLRNGLRDVIADRAALSRALDGAGIREEQRPEEIGVQGFTSLVKAVGSLCG